MLRPRIDGRYQHQSPKTRIAFFRTDGGHHDGNATSVRSSQQIKICNTKSVPKLQDSLGGCPQSAIDTIFRRREAGSQIVDGIDGCMRRQRGDGESPGKGISHQAVNQYERRA